jgi:trimeric autotransporter adhesin
MRVAQMRFLEGKFSAAQFNDLAAYIAGKLGGTPSYMDVTAMPVPMVSASSMNFGAIDLLVTSATQTLTVTNAASATAPLALGAISTTSGSDFSVAGGSCKTGDSIPVGSSCTVLLTFTPTMSGTRSGQLNVFHNGSAQVSTVSLTGTGAGEAPVVSITPSALSFSQTVGTTSSALSLQIANTGKASLQLSSLSFTGTHANDFALTSAGTCAAGGTLAGGASCTASVTFTPGAAGQRSASLVIGHNGMGGSSTVTLSGSGNSTPQPGLALDANRLDLGDQVVATPGTARTLTLVNNGQAALSLNSITVQGSQASEFSLGGTCAVGTPVAVQQSCTIAVTLTPTALGARTATLAIASNAPVGTVNVALAGTGVPTPTPVVQLSQAGLNFGTVTIGSNSAARTVVLTNAGTSALSLSSIAASSADFRVTHDCPASLPAGEACTLSVVFSPNSAVLSEALVIRSNAASSPNSIVLNGLGTSTSLPVIDWTEGSAPLAFDTTAVGAASTATLRTLVNRGPGSVKLSAFTIAGTDASSFVVSGGTCAAGTTLAANASCTVGLRFAPSALGARQALLQVSTTGSNPPELTMSGTGEGHAVAQASVTTEPAVLDYRSGTLVTGTRSAPLEVRITNSGGTDSTLKAVTTTAGFVVRPASGSDACPGVPWTLAPGASCKVAVEFAPTTGGETRGTLSVTTTANQTTSVELTGEATSVMTNEGYAGTGAGAFSPAWLMLLVAAVVALRATPAEAVEPGQPAPQVKLDIPGASNLDALKGQVVYLDFWASYCGPCRRSFPWMNEMQARYGARGLRVIGVNLDGKRADAERFLAQVPAQFSIAYDPSGDSPRRYAVKAMPTSLLIGPDGRVLRVHSGFHDDQRAELEAAIVQALSTR